MSLNVNRNVQDPFYRYKMPRLMAKVEGRGNGIKTVVSNMTEIARALDRPPAYPTKFFGCELGAQVQMEEAADRYIVNGSHQSERLQELLDTFIQKFVLCQNCENPETKLRVTPKKNIEQTCVACGHRQNIDMTHKLTTFIINHPPNEVEDKKKKAKEEKKKAKEGHKEGDASPTTPESIDPGVATVRGNVAQRARGGDVDAPAAVDIDDNAVDWSEDTSEAAVRARQEQLGAGVAALTMTDDLEKSSEERLTLFHDYVKKRLGKEPFPNKEIVGEADRLECKDKGVMVLVELLWDAEEISTVMERIKKYTPVMSRFCDENEKAQKYLLGSIERLIGLHPKLLSQIPRIFKELYDNDMVSEKVFFHWAEKASKKYVSKELSQEIHTKAEKFIEWLKTAETEDEDEEDEDGNDDDDDGGDEVGFDDKAKGIQTVDEKTNGKAAAPDDDVDIDAI